MWVFSRIVNYFHKRKRKKREEAALFGRRTIAAKWHGECEAGYKELSELSHTVKLAAREARRIHNKTNDENWLTVNNSLLDADKKIETAIEWVTQEIDDPIIPYNLDEIQLTETNREVLLYWLNEIKDVTQSAFQQLELYEQSENFNRTLIQSHNPQQETSTQTQKKPLSQIIREMPYTEDRTGQAFITLGSKPKSAMKETSDSEQGESDKKDGQTELTQTSEPTLYDRIIAKGYDNSRVGQAFIQFGGKPPGRPNHLQQNKEKNEGSDVNGRVLSQEIIKDAFLEAAKLLRQMASDDFMSYPDPKIMLDVTLTKVVQWITQNHKEAVKHLSDLDIEQQLRFALKQAGVLKDLNSEEIE